MERKFYEQGYGLKPLMVKKSIPYKGNEVNTYVKLNRNSSGAKRSFQVKIVENPVATRRVYNLDF